ncbi:cytochrome P450 [Myxococcus landrumensis]|uniref:Cytochrome P450 n=1 Tax=Myxococcus landrumensis TaxID=2813577 RepID=A0ABX7N8C4_9BACT|nr:cytochrome P450 [Myxococcus landrumus]QSQ15005.1 cytochrome P450 [Myxococcus landrumus]
MEPDFNPAHPAFRADPHRWLGWLRERDPVHFSPRLNAWVLTRYDDVRRAATDVSHFSNDTLSVLVGKHAGAMGPRRTEHRIGTNLGMADGAVHTRLRAAIAPSFTPAAIQRLEGELQHFVDGLLRRAASGGELDLVAGLGRPLAVEAVASGLFGIPEGEREPLFGWAAATTRISDPLLTREERRENFLELTRFADYLDALIVRRRQQPGDDLLSRIADTDRSGLSHPEVLATCMSIVGGGIDTVSMGISRGILALLDHPGQMELLRENPDLLPGATEEILRFCAPAVFAARVVRTDLELKEKTLKAGDVVLYSPAAACRDPAVFSDPDRLDLRREVERGHNLAFGHGAHYCIGAALARLELRVAFRGVLSRLPRLELKVPRSFLTYGRNLMSMGIESLPVTFRPGPPQNIPLP